MSAKRHTPKADAQRKRAEAHRARLEKRRRADEVDDLLGVSRATARRDAAAAPHHGGGARGGQPVRAGKRRPSRHERELTMRELWIEGARLRTLPLAIAPVVMGTAAAIFNEPRELHWVRALLCLVVALCLQIGVNYANDYSDGIRGTDAKRVGPQRVTASGRVPARRVLIVAFSFFGAAALAGLVLTVLTQQWWLILVGLACIVAAWFYTGGKRPYGYAGLGEVFVFVFFGLVATLGTEYVQILRIEGFGWLLAVTMGCIACAVLIANNVRDIEQDRAVGKRTLSVLIGARASRVLYSLLVLAPFVTVFLLSAVVSQVVLVFLLLFFAAALILIMFLGHTPREQVLVLKLTTIYALVYAVSLGTLLVWPMA